MHRDDCDVEDDAAIVVDGYDDGDGEKVRQWFKA